jgi:hypothetical protein
MAAVLDAGHRTAAFEHRWWTATSVWFTVAALGIIGIRAAFYVRARRRA